MNRTLKEHMDQLERRLQLLNAKIMDESNTTERNQLESELRAVESALTLYRAAYETEQRIGTAK